jgi:hypothetical protein
MSDVGYARFTRRDLTSAERSELKAVDALAIRLRDHLAEQARSIDLVHVHNARSSAVQELVSALLREDLGFGEEVVLTPQQGLVTRARPDFFFPLSRGRGILAEVERGGTTTNNHDLKDMWKAHISPDAQHLFLIVPNANWNESGDARERPFNRVTARLGAFFGDPRREIDVLSTHVFGYGRNA